MRTKMITLYAFSELDARAQERALEAWSQHAGSDLDYSCIYDDAATVAAFMGLDIIKERSTMCNGTHRVSKEPAIYWSGFWSQGDGACFEGSWRAKDVQPGKVKDHAPQDAELHRIAAEFERIAAAYPEASFSVRHRGHYHHEGCTSFEFEDGGFDFDTWEASHPGATEDDAQEACDVWREGFDEQALQEATRDLMRWIYRQLEAEYTYQTSEEVGREMLGSEGEVFTAKGDRE